MLPYPYPYRRFEQHGAAWALITPPVDEPIDVTEARQYLSLTQTNDDRVIEALTRAAREEAEAFMGRGLLTQTWRLELNRFYDVMALPMAWPLQNNPSGTPSTAPVVQYYDVSDVLQTLDPLTYTVDTASRPGQLVRASGQSWPGLSTDRAVGRVLIAYVVGYTTPVAVPERIKQGIRMRLASFYADREGFEVMNAGARAACEACWSDVVYWPPPSEQLWPWPYRDAASW